MPLLSSDFVSHGQRPSVLAFQARDQAGHVLPHPGAGFGPGEPAGDPFVHPVQLRDHEINYHNTYDPLRMNQVPLQY